MAKHNYNNDDLLKSIKLRMMVPEDQIAFSDDDILILASEELNIELLPNIMRAREEFYVYVNEQEKNNSGIYQIPSRAAGSKVRIVFLKDSNGNLYNCSEIDVSEQPQLNTYYATGVYDPTFYVQNDELHFLNHTGQTIAAQYVDIHYYLNPNDLVVPSAALTITGIDRNSGLINVAEKQIPDTFQNGVEIDFIQYKPQNRTVSLDIELISVSSNTPVTSQKFISVDPSSIPDDLIVGDYIALAGESPVPQIPADLRPVLAQATACRLLEAQGDLNNLTAAYKKLETMTKRMFNLIQDRTEGNPKKVVNRTGIMRASLIGFYNYNRYKG